MSDSKTETLLDLAIPRKIVIADRGRNYVLYCRNLTDGDWKTYFDSIVVSNEQRGKVITRVNDFNSGLIALAESVLMEASGYKVAGGAELISLPEWQKCIPVAHRLKLGDVLASAMPSKSGDLTIYPEGEVVMLDATWSAASESKMQRFEGLKHTLATPTEDQHRRYRNESSRSFVEGGSRAGKTFYRSTYPLLAKLYDELVISVDGYAVSGDKLEGSSDAVRAAIRANMDSYHKAIAARQLFQPELPEVGAEEEGEA